MIIIHTILNAKVGIGNFSRCYSIYRALLEKGIASVFFVEGSHFLANQFNLDDIIFVNTIEEIQEIFKQHQGLFIVDLPVATNIEINFYKSRKHKVILLNDQFANEINPAIYINGDDALKYTFPKSKKYVGAHYQIIRRDLLDQRTNNYIPIKSAKNVGIMFGGTDPGHLTEQFISLLKEQNLLERTFYVYLGSGFGEKRKSKLKCSKPKNVIFVENTPVKDFFNSINVIVNMGGLTSYEAMCIGIPVFAFEWSYMEKYVKYMSDEGLLINLGPIDKFSIVTDGQIFSNIERINKTAMHAFQLVDGKGIDRIIKIIYDRN